MYAPKDRMQSTGACNSGKPTTAKKPVTEASQQQWHEQEKGGASDVMSEKPAKFYKKRYH